MYSCTFIVYLCSWHIECRIEPINTNVITVDGFQGTGIVLPDGARTLERVTQSHQMYVYNRYCLFSWY